MAEGAFEKYLGEINKAYLRGGATEHTHRPALVTSLDLIQLGLSAASHFEGNLLFGGSCSYAGSGPHLNGVSDPLLFIRGMPAIYK